MRNQLKKLALSVARAAKFLPYGVEFATDLNRRFPKLTIETIFDVGANVGQSIDLFSSRYPKARIYSFEPDPDTFRRLSSKANGRAFLHQIAFSDESGLTRFDNSCPVSEIHAIAKDQNDTSLPLVKVTTIDAFCAEHSIGTIDILKLDTEGNELKVIEGAVKTIAAKSIKTIFVECSISQNSVKLIGFTKMQKRMRELGFVCLGIYHQSPSWGDLNDPEIRLANCLFISTHLGDAAHNWK